MRGGGVGGGVGGSVGRGVGVGFGVGRGVGAFVSIAMTVAEAFSSVSRDRDGPCTSDNPISCSARAIENATIILVR